MSAVFLAHIIVSTFKCGLIAEHYGSETDGIWFSALSNLQYVLSGRLLRANQIMFNWDRLASWINLTEEWPYRTSWLILFLEENDITSDQVMLKTIYERSESVSALTLHLDTPHSLMSSA